MSIRYNNCRIYVEAPVHFERSPGEPVACMDKIIGESGGAVILCSTRWELVTCMECQRKGLGTVTANVTSYAPKFVPLHAHVASIDFDFNDLPKANVGWISAPPDTMIKDGIAEEADLPAEPERTEGDDLLDFFKGTTR